MQRLGADKEKWILREKGTREIDYSAILYRGGNKIHCSIIGQWITPFKNTKTFFLVLRNITLYIEQLT